MKEYIKTIITGAIAGAVLMQLINMVIQTRLGRPFTMGGEVLLPALIGMVGYIGWMLAESYFKAVRYKEIYRKGFSEGAKINNYKIVIPIEEDTEHEQENGSRAVRNRGHNESVMYE